jgi:hypothetical protein
MIQPETWKRLWDFAQPAWNVFGPFVGIGVGALLGRSWDRKTWLNDKRAEECKELVQAFAHAVSCIFDVEHARQEKGVDLGQITRADVAYNEALRTLKDRLFISRDIEYLKIGKAWVELVRGFYADHDHKKFQAGYEFLRDIVIRLAGENENQKAALTRLRRTFRKTAALSGRPLDSQ